VQHSKPVLIANIDEKNSLHQIANWIKMFDIRIINIAGPRESECPGIYQATKDFLQKALAS
jgi:hypothetical protein